MTIIMTQVAIDTLDLSVSVASQPFGATNQPATDLVAGRQIAC